MDTRTQIMAETLAIIGRLTDDCAFAVNELTDEFAREHLKFLQKVKALFTLDELEG